MILALDGSFLEAHGTASVRLGALQEATVSSNGVADAILCRAMEFCDAVNERANSSHAFRGLLTF
jgi:hypothetical protein